MKKLTALILALICAVMLLSYFNVSSCFLSSAGKGEAIIFHDMVLNRFDLSKETMEWLEWYNELTEEEQLLISYIPPDLYDLCGFEDAEDIVAEAE